MSKISPKHEVHVGRLMCVGTTMQKYHFYENKSFCNVINYVWPTFSNKTEIVAKLADICVEEVSMVDDMGDHKIKKGSKQG